MRIVGAGSVVVLLVLLIPGPALGFDDFGIGCADDKSANVAFSNDPEWNFVINSGPDSGKTFRQAVQSSYNMWVGGEIEKWQGGAALTGGSPTMTMNFLDIPSLAATDCIGDVINFDSDAVNAFINGTTILSGLGAHEWGHVWGLGHSGKNDSFGAGNPTLSTCWGNFNAQRYISQDDNAGIQFRTDKSGSFGSATANSSFEEGTTYWGFQNVNYTHMFYSGGQDGSPNYLRFGGPSSSTAVYSTSRISDSWYDGDEIGADVKGRANYKKSTYGSLGHVLVVAKWAHVDFSGTTEPWANCQLKPGNNNASQSVGSYEFQKLKYCYPGNSWGYCTTAQDDVVSSDSGGRKPEALQMRIVVYNRMKLQGDPVPVDVDRTRFLVVPS